MAEQTGGRSLENLRYVGPKAGALKYDLLTALSVLGLHGSATDQTSIMRLNLLITARYNWRLEEVTVGHVELARLWAVNERTVKREMKRLTAMGVLVCKRPGVRGRVGAYRLNHARIYALSRESWAAVGPDFEDRMIELSGEKTVVAVNFRPALVQDADNAQMPEQGSWGAVLKWLKAEHPDLHQSWFGRLAQEKITDHTLVLRAPNSFVSRYIETHFAGILVDAVETAMPTPDRRPRRIELIHG